MAKKNKKFAVGDIESLEKEFFMSYDCDYWLHKIFMLKNCHDYYDEFEEHLNLGLENVDHDNYKKMLRTELHFLYFQMIETLFEIIFAVSAHDNRDLWIALTFSGDRQTDFYSDAYRKIKDFADDKLKDPSFYTEFPIFIKNEEVKISVLRWIFYFNSSNKLSDEEWKINLKNIYSLLRMFAKDFPDRGEYNAFKHCLRFYNSSFRMGISLTGSNRVTGLGYSKDSITYLEKRKDENFDEMNISRTTKTFDFERDFRCCLIIHELINNIINTRKYQILEELRGKKFSLYYFHDNINYPGDYIPKTGVTKTSFTV